MSANEAMWELLCLVAASLVMIMLCAAMVLWTYRCPNCKSCEIVFRSRDGKNWCGGGEDHPMAEHIDLHCENCGNDWYRLKEKS